MSLLTVCKPFLLGGLPWITLAFAPESALSSLKKNEDGAESPAEPWRRVFWAIFSPDTKTEAAEPSGAWPSTALHFKGSTLAGPHGAGVRPSDHVMGFLLHSPPEPVSKNVCSSGACVPHVTPPGGQEPE